MPSGVVTVPSVFSRNLGFTVTGTNTLAYAQRFASVIDAALDQATLAYTNLSDPDARIPDYSGGTQLQVHEQEISASGSYTLPADTVAGPAYTLVSNSGADTITGSGAGDSLLIAGINAATTYTDQGGNNEVVFVAGNNVYDGDNATGNDTIVAGSGFDTVTTGNGRADVYSGTGHGTMTLRDTLAAGATLDTKSILPSDYNQFVYLDDGQNIVFANGIADVVVSTAPGQVVVGGTEGDTDLVALVPPGADSTIPGTLGASDALPDGNDTIVANGAEFSVFNDSNKNAIFGGSGALTAVFADSVEGSVVGGSGSDVVWGNPGDTISYFSAASASRGVIVMGNGPETLNAKGALAPTTVVVGAGNETLTGGADTTYNLNATPVAGQGDNITIDDFGANDMFNFVNYTQNQYETALQSGTLTAEGYQITLSDHSTVTFVGIKDLIGHTEKS